MIYWYILRLYRCEYLISYFIGSMTNVNTLCVAYHTVCLACGDRKSGLLNTTACSGMHPRFMDLEMIRTVTRILTCLAPQPKAVPDLP